MRHFFRQFTKQDYIFFALCGIAYFFLIRQYIPVLDDFRYHYRYDDWPQPIQSFTDIFKSQTYHYIHTNGRFVVHCIVQFFCGFGNLTSYFILSSLVFVFLLMNATLLIKRDLPFDTQKAGSISCIFPLLLLLFIPQVGIFFFGSVAFTVNYMYSTAVYLCFIWIYYEVKDTPLDWKIWECIILSLVGILCGSWQEAFSICIAGALGIYYIFHFKEVRGALWWLLIGFAIGAIIGVFAPGNFVRITTLEVPSRLKIYDIEQMLKHRLFFQSLIAVTIISLIVDIRAHRPLFICKNWLYYISIVISLLFAACIAYHDLYQLTIIQIFSIILTIKFLYEYCYPALLRRWDKYLATTMIILILVIYLPSLLLRQHALQGYKEVECSIINTHDSIAYDSQLEQFHYVVLPKYHFWGNCVNGVYFHTLYTEPSLVTLRLTGSEQPLYNLILPDSVDNIRAMCDESNQIADSIFISPNKAYLIVRLKQSNQAKNYILVERTVANNPISRTKDRLKKRVYKENKYTLQPSQFIRKFTHEEYIYYIVPILQTEGRIVDKRWLEEL